MVQMFFYQGGDFFFTLFWLIFIIVAGLFVYNIGKGVLEWHSNNNAPKITATAKIVGKRQNMNMCYHSTGNGNGACSTSTNYYVTFELEDGQRLEFHVKDRVYGLLAEGDCGTLSYQGTRYLKFKRNS